MNKLLKRKYDYLLQFGELEDVSGRVGKIFVIYGGNKKVGIYLSPEGLFTGGETCDHDESGFPFNCKPYPPFRFKKFKKIVDMYIKDMLKKLNESL